MRGHVVLWGPPASGKTTLGRALAARLGMAAIDTDAEIERAAGRSVAEIFASEGEAGFRTRERRALDEALAQPEPAVISVGGGALLDRALRQALLRRATVLSLDAPAPLLAARASTQGGVRPLLVGDARARIEALLDARAGAYAEAHARISTDGEPEQTLGRALEALADMARHPTLVVPLGVQTYRVYVSPLATLGPRVRALGVSATVLVTDARVLRATGGVAALGGLFPAARVVLRVSGERGKTLASVRAIWDAALGAGIDRDALIVALGGGVVSDLAGFAAATLLRGVRYASAPTTLLAMADASVGGKTGFDHPRGKNLLGAFHQPSLVVCDPRVLAMLPARDLRAGLAEIVKVALVRDPALLAALARDALRLSEMDLDALGALLPAAIQAKIDVVVRDPFEQGERAVLNFGHTLGHAIERASRYRLPHGECVALGMRGAIMLGERLGITPAALAREALGLLDALGMPRAPACWVDRDEALRALASDKKRRAGALRFVLLDAAGSALLTAVSRRDAVAALDAVLETRIGRAR